MSIEDLIAKLNDNAPRLAQQLDELATHIEMSMTDVRSKLSGFQARSDELRESAERAAQMIIEPARAIEAEVLVLTSELEADVLAFVDAVPQEVQRVADIAQNFGERVRQQMGTAVSELREHLIEPASQATEAFSSGLEELIETTKSEFVDGTIDSISDGIYDELTEVLEAVGQLFDEKADDIAEHVRRIIREGLEENSSLVAAIDQLRPVLGELQPITDQVSNLAATVGLG